MRGDQNLCGFGYKWMRYLFAQLNGNFVWADRRLDNESSRLDKVKDSQ